MVVNIKNKKKKIKKKKDISWLAKSSKTYYKRKYGEINGI